MADEMHVLLLTGTAATGKTTIATEIGEILPPTRAIVVVDLDQLGWAFIPGASEQRIFELRSDNLAAIWPNLRSAGFRHVVLSGAVSTAEQLQLIRDAIGQARLTVVRLVTSKPLLERRLRSRDAGRRLDDHLAIVWRLEDAIDQAALEDVRVVNDERSPREIAMDVLQKVQWT